MLPRRWPLHPAPRPGEALSSWLSRVAGCYRMSPRDLLLHDLGDYQEHDLDIDPPDVLLDALAGRSGIDLDQLRGMSLAGWTPWLLDRLDPEPSAYAIYVHQLSVLLPLRRRRARNVSGWRAWLPMEPINRACPQCLLETANDGFLLIWRLPLMLSCPEHRCWLEPYRGGPTYFIEWESNPCQPRPISESIAMMDRRTWEALTTGQVALPRRRIHAGLWFRLLRTVLDELNTPLSCCASQTQDIRAIWKSCGYAARAGQSYWRPYEALALPVQLQMLEAAATAIHLIETGSLTARGEFGALFLPEPVPEVADGRSPDTPTGQVTSMQAAMAALDEVIAEARHNPATARALFNLAWHGRTDPDSIRQAQVLMAELKVPVDFLSHLSAP